MEYIFQCRSNASDCQASYSWWVLCFVGMNNVGAVELLGTLSSISFPYLFSFNYSIPLLVPL